MLAFLLLLGAFALELKEEHCIEGIPIAYAVEIPVLGNIEANTVLQFLGSLLVNFLHFAAANSAVNAEAHNVVASYAECQANVALNYQHAVQSRIRFFLLLSFLLLTFLLLSFFGLLLISHICL